GDDPDVAGGVDGAGAIRHGFCLLAADLAVHGVELAVHVRDADFIQIHQREVADARAREGFDGPRADAADADDGDARVEEAIQGCLAVKPGDASEAMRDGIWHGGKMQWIPRRSHERKFTARAGVSACWRGFPRSVRGFRPGLPPWPSR